MPFRPRLVIIGLVAAAISIAAATPASAGPLMASADDCAAQPLSKPFTPWLDYANYTQLTEGTQTLSAGESIVSPSICVGLQHPTLRFFSKRESGWMLTSSMRVEVLVTDAQGSNHSLPIGQVINGGSWQPTLPLPIIVNALSLAEQTSVAFRYTAVGGDWSIGDVWVDPYARK